MYVTAVIVHIQRNKAHRDDARNYSFAYTYIHTYVQVPRICLSNRGTPRRRAEKLCHFHIFRPALTSPVSREIHLRSNLNFKPVKFYIAAGSRPPVFAAGTGNEGGWRKTWRSLYVRLHSRGGEVRCAYRVDQLIRVL